MKGFLKIDFELLQSGLSAGAAILYAFIQYRMYRAPMDEDGDRFINWSGDNDPRPVLNLTKRQLMYQTDELRKAGLITTIGSGMNFKLYFGDKNVTEPSDKNVTIEEQNCHRESNKSVTEPNKNNKQVCRNSRNVCRRSNTHAPVIIPTIDEVEAEAESCGYKTDVKKFYDYNRMRGWQSIQDWRQALALWVTNEPQHRRTAKSMTGADAGLSYTHIPYTVHSIDEVDTENAPSIDIDIDIIDIGG